MSPKRKLTPAQITQLEAIWDREIGAGKSPWDAALALVEHALKDRPHAFKKGDRVRYNAWGTIGGVGTVEKVVPLRRLRVGGTSARIQVRWDASREVGVVEDRELEIWY